MQCLLNAPISDRVDKIVVLDWNRANCPAEMTYDTGTNNCACLEKYYDAGSACVGCLDYCGTCGDSLTCIEADGNRDITGNFACFCWGRGWYIPLTRATCVLLYGLYFDF